MVYSRGNLPRLLYLSQPLSCSLLLCWEANCRTENTHTHTHIHTHSLSSTVVLDLHLPFLICNVFHLFFLVTSWKQWLKLSTVFMLWGMKRTSALMVCSTSMQSGGFLNKLQASLYEPFQPISGAILARILLNEHISLRTAIGAVVILLGVVSIVVTNWLNSRTATASATSKAEGVESAGTSTEFQEAAAASHKENIAIVQVIELAGACKDAVISIASDVEGAAGSEDVTAVLSL